MTTVRHNPVTDGPFVMRLDDDEGNPQAFDAVQVRIQAGAVCIPVNGTPADDGPQWDFTIPELPVRVYPATIHADAGDGFAPVGEFLLQITGAC